MIYERRWALLWKDHPFTKNGDAVFVALGRKVALYDTKVEALEAAEDGETPIRVEITIEEQL